MTSATGGSDAALVERTLTPADGDRLVALSEEAGWNQTAADWRLMLRHGHGVGLWTSAGTPVASALLLPYGTRFAWISMVLTAAPWRRRGLAQRLLDRCLETARGRGLIAVLDATDDGRRVYGSHGFAELWTFARLEATDPRPPPARGARVRPMTAADLAVAAALDAVAFGVERAAILAALLRRRPELALIAHADGQPRGFALGRDGSHALHLGPVVADTADTALALAATALAGAAGRVIIDAPDAQAGFRAALAAAGFVARRGFTRMSLGGSLGDPAMVFAVAGPELG
jgi:ribosomal protein S18 acetylase RimI-like enzyme